MNCIRNIRNLALRFDLFAASPTLRVNGQTDYEHVCCGSFSILLILAFIGIFAQQIIDVLNKAEIQASVNLDDKTGSDDVGITDIKFALGIDQIKLDDIGPYFGIQLIISERIPGQDKAKQTKLDLKFCTEEIWKGYGDKLQHYFQVFKIHDMYCLPDDANISLEGYEGSESQISLYLRINTCKGPQCITGADFDTYMNNHLDQYDYFKVRLLFVDTIISPSDPTVTQKTLEKDVFLTFSQTMGSRGQIVLGRYEVTTDQSIWPFELTTTQSGHYIQKFQTNSIQIRSDHYIVLQISKSTLVYTVERFHKKIDDLLSYIGGLFALIFVVLFFFMAPFNEYRYELMVAENSFSYDQHGRKIKEKDMTIWVYLKYAFYDMFKMLGCKFNWQDMKKIDEAREEANLQLDVRTIMKKLRHFQKLSSILMDQYMLVSSQITKPLTINESKRKRKILEYYDKIMKDKVTDDEFGNVYNILGMSTNKYELPIEQLRKSNPKDLCNKTQDNMNSENFKNDKQGEVKVENNEEQKKYEEFDSDDEQAQKYIFQMLQKLQEDDSERAKNILNKIPQYIKVRMNKNEKKIVTTEGNHFIMLGLQ